MFVKEYDVYLLYLYRGSKCCMLLIFVFIFLHMTAVYRILRKYRIHGKKPQTKYNIIFDLR